MRTFYPEKHINGEICRIVVYDDYDEIDKNYLNNIVDVLNSSFSSSYSIHTLKLMKSIIPNTKKTYYVCFFVGKTIAGYCNVTYSMHDSSQEEKLFLFNLAVHSDFRRFGIASLILKRLICLCDKNNFRLEVDNDQDVEWKSKFYNKFGFETEYFNQKLNRYCLKYKQH